MVQMKKLILMRHSDAEIYGVTDFERKLTENGIIKAKTSAIKLDEYLEKNNTEIEFLFSSSAIRTKETLEYVTCLLEIKETPYQLTSNLYMVGLRELKKVLFDYNNKIKNLETIMIIAHNNGISKIASRLTGMSLYFSTANIAILTFDDKNNWSKSLEFEGNWELDFFI